MKRLLLFYVMTTLLLGCSSDDDDAIPLEPLVTGTWKMTNAIIEQGIDIEGMKVLDLLQEVNCYQNETITFNEDGTALVSTNSFLKVEASLVEGTQDEYTYAADCVNDSDTYSATWSIVDRDLLLTEEDGFVSRVPNFGGGQFMVFSIPEGFEILRDDGTTIHAEEDILLVYKRQ
ncbi:lipocalin family protein [uncultured Kordia sp.]|uniref:lipocalin family protein n=1 Tax=uncultured Kordia sp. TaxID=507699 RepID=UPI0026396729|nr:lipocalin family protein [uncultured Kordia sp.]